MDELLKPRIRCKNAKLALKFAVMFVLVHVSYDFGLNWRD